MGLMEAFSMFGIWVLVTLSIFALVIMVKGIVDLIEKDDFYD